MLVTQFDKFVNRSTQEILGSEIERENLEPMLSTDIRNGGGVTGVKGNAEIYYRTGNVNLTPADLGALDTDNVYNGLDETAEGYALDARQGKALNEAIEDKLDKANVYNGLDKTEAGYALDARQGKALNDKINNTQSDVSIINAILSTITGYASNANGDYWKYEDGTLICAKSVSQEVTFSAWGSLYESTLINYGNWPYAFKTGTIPFVVVQLKNSDITGFLTGTGLVSATSAGQGRAVRPNNPGGIQTYSIDIIAIGRWK